MGSVEALSESEASTVVLTKEAQKDRDEFDSVFGGAGCTCSVKPPCARCTHPGNPANQIEDDSCWHDPLTSAIILALEKNGC